MNETIQSWQKFWKKLTKLNLNLIYQFSLANSKVLSFIYWLKKLNNNNVEIFLEYSWDRTMPYTMHGDMIAVMINSTDEIIAFKLKYAEVSFSEFELN